DLAAHGNVAFGAAGEADAGVAHGDEVVDGLAAGLAVVTGDERGGRVLGVAVDQDDGQAPGDEGLVTFARSGGVRVTAGDEDDARDVAFQQQFNVFVLGYTAGGLGAQHGGEPPLSQGALGSLGEHREDGVAEFGHDHADQSGRPLPQ